MLMCLQPEPKAFQGYYNMLGIQPIYLSVWRKQKLWIDSLYKLSHLKVRFCCLLPSVI